MQRRGARGERDRVARTEVRGERLLEGGGAGAERQPAGAQRLRDRLQVLLLQAQVEERQLWEGVGCGHRVVRATPGACDAQGMLR